MMSLLTAVPTFTVEQVVDIFQRLRSGQIEPEDLDSLEATVGSYLKVLELIQTKGMSMRQLRQVLCGLSNEKLEKILRDAAARAEANGSAGGSASGDGSSSAGGGEDAADTADRSEPSPPDDGDAQAAQPRRKGHGRNGVDAYAGAEQIEVPHESLKRGDPCPLCPKGKVYPLTPMRLVRIVGQQPFQAFVYALARLRCNLCGEVFTARAPPEAGRSKYHASAAAMLAILRYGTGLPMYRMEKLQAAAKVPLPDGTQWRILSEASQTVAPVHTELLRQAAQAETLYNDDTFVQILSLTKENEERDPKKERTGVFTTGIVAETAENRRIVVYASGRNHAGENLRELLRHRAAGLEPPVQMCDGLERNLPGELETVVANCLVHGRRYFVRSYAAFPAECRHVLEKLAEVYHNDALARQQGLDPAQRLAFHREQSGPVMAELKDWLEAKRDSKEIEPSSGLGRAVRYMLKRWERLTLFLRRPGAPLDSNSVERALKKAILHRKNSLFYKTENGAHVGDTFMSLIYTCR